MSLRERHPIPTARAVTHLAAVSLLVACMSLGLASPAHAGPRENVACGAGDRGTLVVIHGGSFIYRVGRRYLRTICRSFSGRGFRTVAVAYPERDYSGALRAVRETVDRARPPVYIYGESAGGNLAAMVAPKRKVRAVAIVGAPTNLVTWARENVDFWNYLGMTIAQRRAGSPALRKLPRRRPPFWIAHSPADKVVPFGQSRRFAAKLGERVVRLDGDHLRDLSARKRAGRWLARRAAGR